MRRFEARALFSSEDLDVLAVESTDVGSRRSRSGCLVYAKIEPVAVVVRTADGLRAVDLEGNPVRLESLLELVPALDRWVRRSGRGSGHED